MKLSTTILVLLGLTLLVMGASAAQNFKGLGRGNNNKNHKWGNNNYKNDRFGDKKYGGHHYNNDKDCDIYGRPNYHKGDDCNDNYYRGGHDDCDQYGSGPSKVIKGSLAARGSLAINRGGYDCYGGNDSLNIKGKLKAAGKLFIGH